MDTGLPEGMVAGMLLRRMVALVGSIDVGMWIYRSTYDYICLVTCRGYGVRLRRPPYEVYLGELRDGPRGNGFSHPGPLSPIYHSGVPVP